MVAGSSLFRMRVCKFRKLTEGGLAGPFGEILGQWRGEGEDLARGGVGESQLPCMEHVTLKFSAPAIGRVSRHGMPEVFQVNADLVRATSLGMALDESFSLAGIQHTVVSQSLAAPIDDGHFLAVDGVPTDGGIDFSVRHAGDSIDQGEVGFFDIPGGELIGERAVGLFGFCDHKDSGSFLVESVNDARTLRSAHDLDACAVVKEAVGKGAFAVSRAGVDDEAGGFVEDEEVFILEKNAQRHLLRGEG